MTAPLLRPTVLPRIAVSGTPFERGRQYGRQARDRIGRSLAHYARVFEHRAGLDWPQAVRHARSYERSIAAFLPAAIEEIRGIADGAGVERDDILAINARSEIMFAAGSARAPARPGGSPAECTSFAVLPEASAEGHILVGQNWDWLPFAHETVMMLEVRRDEAPSYVTIVEAGLLAKTGFNEAGLGVCTNTLVSTLDDGKPGVPYHVLLRALLDAETMSQAMRTLYGPERALSANYMIAHADGLAANVETLPGGTVGVHVALPEHGVLAHANHFLWPDFAKLDARVALHPNTIFRTDAMRRGLDAARPGVTVEALQEILRRHQNHPDGLCSHPDERMHPMEQRATIMSVIADLTLGTIWMANGPPCAHAYERHAYRAALQEAREAASVA